MNNKFLERRLYLKLLYREFCWSFCIASFQYRFFFFFFFFLFLALVWVFFFYLVSCWSFCAVAFSQFSGDTFFFLLKHFYSDSKELDTQSSVI